MGNHALCGLESVAPPALQLLAVATHNSRVDVRRAYRLELAKMAQSPAADPRVLCDGEAQVAPARDDVRSLFDFVQELDEVDYAGLPVQLAPHGHQLVAPVHPHNPIMNGCAILVEGRIVAEHSHDFTKN